MSELALDHYSQRARTHGHDTIPEILNGESFSLLDDTKRLSIHSPRADVVQELQQNYIKAIEEVGAFVVANSSSPSHVTHSPKGNLNHTNRQHIEKVHKVMVPKTVKAGHLSDFLIEAVAPEEIDDSLYGRLLNEAPPTWLWKDTYNHALLVVSAKLYAGRTLGRAATLTAVTLDSAQRQFRVANIGFKTNELLARSGQWQSEAIATYIDHWGLEQPVVQAVRRGKNDHGRGRGTH